MMCQLIECILRCWSLGALVPPYKKKKKSKKIKKLASVIG